MEALIQMISDEQTGRWSFARLEKLVWHICLEVFRQVLTQILLDLDLYLLATRDRRRYRCREVEERELVTLVGDIVIKRRAYKDRLAGRQVYLLDEWLNLPPYQQISLGVEEAAVLWAVKGPSYRDARDRLKDLYGHQALSHESIRRRVIRRGEMLACEEENTASADRATCTFLGIEADGFWVSMQKRKESEKKKKREVKLAVMHAGWSVRQGKEKVDYALKEKLCHLEAGERGGEAFWEKVRGRAARRYGDIDRVQVVINGDEAPWIRQGVEHFARAIYQYDRFHIARELYQGLRGQRDKWEEARQALEADDIPALCRVLEAASAGAEDPKRREHLKKLCARVRRDGAYIIDYRVRLQATGQEVPPGWRSMGAGESNVGKFKSRLGGRSWSDAGLRGLGHCLAALFEGRLLSSGVQPKEQALEEEKPCMGAGRLVKSAAKTITSGIKRGHFPALDRGTDGFAVLLRQLSRIPSLVI